MDDILNDVIQASRTCTDGVTKRYINALERYFDAKAGKDDMKKRIECLSELMPLLAADFNEREILRREALDDIIREYRNFRNSYINMDLNIHLYNLDNHNKALRHYYDVMRDYYGGMSVDDAHKRLRPLLSAESQNLEPRKNKVRRRHKFKSIARAIRNSDDSKLFKSIARAIRNSDDSKLFKSIRRYLQRVDGDRSVRILDDYLSKHMELFIPRRKDNVQG
jgi:hypothetical protein